MGQDYNKDYEDQGLQILDNNKKEVHNTNEAICFLRRRWLNEPLPLPSKLNSRINAVMEAMSIPM